MTTSNGLAVVQSAEMATWNLLREQAAVLVKSGFLPSNVKTAESALAIMVLGQELGFQRMQSFRLIDVIQGKPALNAAGQAALVQAYCTQHGGYLRQVELTNQRCTVEYKRQEWPEAQRFTFSMDDAKTAGLSGKDTWKNHPRNMLFARAVANACRMGWPEVVGGLYDPEELQATRTPQPVNVQAVEVLPELEAIEAVEVIDTETVDIETGEIIDVAVGDDPKRAMKFFHAVGNDAKLTDWALHLISCGNSNPTVDSRKDVSEETYDRLARILKTDCGENSPLPDWANKIAAAETMEALGIIGADLKEAAVGTVWMRHMFNAKIKTLAVEPVAVDQPELVSA